MRYIWTGCTSSIDQTSYHRLVQGRVYLFTNSIILQFDTLELKWDLTTTFFRSPWQTTVCLILREVVGKSGSTNKLTANAMLQCLPTSLLSADDVNNFWGEWSDVYMTVIADTIRTKCIKPKSKVPYRLTDDFIHLVRKKCRLFWHAKRVGTAIAWAKYTKVRISVTSALCSTKKNLFQPAS